MADDRGGTAAVRLEEVRWRWPGGATLLDIPAFSVPAGGRVLLRGPSGAGKSTLLGLIAGVLAPQAGRVEVLGRDLAALTADTRDRLRADRIGVIFQSFNLLPYLSVLANVTLPCRFSTARRAAVAASGETPEGAARRLLARLGIGPDLIARPVARLSVGQQQRVAAARALIGGPALILADEPTSALDADRRDAFLALLLEAARETGAAVLLVSHDPGLAPQFERVLHWAELNRSPAVAAAETAA